MRICYFGEMDSYTGSVRAARELLPELIGRLKVMCALQDFVIVAPGNLVEHALALPLFEALGPLVRDRRRTTRLRVATCRANPDRLCNRSLEAPPPPCGRCLKCRGTQMCCSASSAGSVRTGIPSRSQSPK